jgi:serine/threonine protein kinase
LLLDDNYRLTGCFPFYDDKDVRELYKKIVAVSYAFPSNVTLSPEAKDFVSNLIVGDPTKRMTPVECWNHPWLKDAYCLQQYTTQSYSLLGGSEASSSSSESSSTDEDEPQMEEGGDQMEEESSSTSSDDSSDRDEIDQDEIRKLRDNNNDEEEDDDSIILDSD